VSQLTAMLERNKSNKGLAPQIQAKLDQVCVDTEMIPIQHNLFLSAITLRLRGSALTPRVCVIHRIGCWCPPGTAGDV
jgi:hypothetical protein